MTTNSTESLIHVFRQKRMIKDIYRQFYSKLAFEWLDELKICYPFRFSSPEIPEFFVLHLAVGLSFIAVFCDTFRYDFAKYRKAMFNALRGCLSSSQYINSQNPIQIAKCIDTCKLYLQDRQLIAAATPFDRDPWRSHLFQIIIKFNSKSGQQLNIDLNAANI